MVTERAPCPPLAGKYDNVLSCPSPSERPTGDGCKKADVVALCPDMTKRVQCRRSVLHNRPMTDEDHPPDRESDQGAWTRLRGWSKKHQRPLLILGFGFTAAALVTRGRGAGNDGSVMDSAAVAAEAAAAAAAEASERVAREFQALSRDYNMAAMDQTVGQAIRRHQRWSPEELAVLRDTGKTALEKALELARTYNGVMAKSIKEGASSRAP